MDANWKSGSKVFETEEEATQYAKDMMARGIVVCWGKTFDRVTDKYVGPDALTTRP